MPITPKMVALAEAFRLALLARERRSATALVQYYGRIWGQMQGEIIALQKDVAALKLAGKDVKEAIRKLERLQRLQLQLEDELDKYARFADTVVQGGQRMAVAAGEREAYALQLAAYPPGVDVGITLSRLPTEALESLIGVLADGSPLRDVLRKRAGDAAKEFAQVLVDGLAEGWNPRKVARAARDKFGMGLTDALRISRTEQLRAYRTATLDAYDKSPVVTAWERLASKDDRTCMACILLDGKVYSTKEAMDDHPQGRCACMPVVKSYKDLGLDVDMPVYQRELGKDWFLAQDDATQRKMMGALYEPWKAGQLDLSRIPKLNASATWGNSWTVASLTDLGLS